MGKRLQNKRIPSQDEIVGLGRPYGVSRARRAGIGEMMRLGDRQPGITEREREVLTWAARGLSARDIGVVLNIGKRTVDEHAQTAARKLGASNKTQAVAIAIRDRLIEVDPA